MSDFSPIKEEIIAEKNHFIESLTKYVRADDKWHKDAVSRWLTPKRKERYLAGDLSEGEALTFADVRIKKRYEDERDRDIKFLEALSGDDVRVPESIMIMVQFPSRGTTVKATAKVDGFYFEGRAGGWGYDKESAAIADALNKCDGVRKLLCELKVKGLKEGKKSHSEMAITTIDNRDVICYGCGYTPIPYFDGGCGTECYLRAFEIGGYRYDMTWSKDARAYSIYKKKV